MSIARDVRADGWAYLICVAGAVLRLTRYALGAPWTSASGEAWNVARSVAQSGMIGDPFGRGSGPTAHFTPVMPLISGSVYRVFGIDSATSEAILCLMSVATCMAAALLLFQAFRLAGTPRVAALAGLALFAFLPVNFTLEVVSFRAWEGGLAMLLSAYVLTRLHALNDAAPIGFGALILPGLALALLLLVSPLLGLPCLAAVMLFVIFKRDADAFIKTAIVGAAAVLLVFAPWVWRNGETFGRFIPLRSNFGIELALGNHDAAVSGRDQAIVFKNRLKEIHPQESERAFERYQQAGEIAYYDSLASETKTWIAQHPASFAILCVRHWLQFYFPPLWQWRIYDPPRNADLVKITLTWLFAGLGLAGAAWAMMRAFRRYAYLLCVLLLPSVPYMIVQPVLRYHYVVWAPSLFFSTLALAKLIEAARRRLAGRTARSLEGLAPNHGAVAAFDAGRAGAR